MSKEAMKLRTAAEKVVELCSERPLSLGKWFIDMSEACDSLREALAKPDFWEGYVPEPVKPAQCAPAEDGVCEALDCSNHKPAQQEPVAWTSPHGGFLSANYINNFASGLDKEIHNIPLYTSPPAQRTWVGLTDEELSEVYNQADWDTVNGWEYERAIEAKLRSKNEDRN
jgi:hypothetical protein